MQLWAGVECTLNRVGDRYRDQTRLSGHHARIDDLNRFAELGIKALRYPVLWEQISPDDPATCNWNWHDARLARLRELGIRPIVGLVHHGSGPRYTDLLDPGFAEGLARHARHVAERYPWIEDWTPVNEPLTTARFAALYGHWYPHARDEGSFCRALLNQFEAIMAAMREIRQVQPNARLIQTEDFGRTLATSDCRVQADFDNTRRWITWDVLRGDLDRHHPLWNHFVGFGLQEQLVRLGDAPCSPDVLGINHYLTSDRFLDHRIALHDAKDVGRTPAGEFADIEAVRVRGVEPPGLEGAIREAWERYGIPVAVTELHNGCTREEQMRWFAEGWDIASRLAGEGIPIEAVTAWSLLGAVDWNSLLTKARDAYEIGVYDIRSSPPRATAMAELLQTLGQGKRSAHPVIAGQGWWRRDDRYLVTAPHGLEPVAKPDPTRQREILIVGKTGTLGRALAHECAVRNLPCVSTGRGDLALHDRQSIVDALDRVNPWAVINAAGWVRVDDAEREHRACRAANTIGSIALGEACAARGIHYTTFSSDLVFDGAAGRPYVESDQIAPLNVYGSSKAEADGQLVKLDAAVLIVRTAAFFAASDPHNFAAAVERALSSSGNFAASACHYISPTYVPDLVRAVLDLVIDGEQGLWHLANQGDISWYGFARMIAEALGHDKGRIVPDDGQVGWVAARPKWVPLISERGVIMPHLDDAVARYSQAVADRPVLSLAA